jgi:hypothetical protein
MLPLLSAACCSTKVNESEPDAAGLEVLWNYKIIYYPFSHPFQIDCGFI